LYSFRLDAVEDLIEHNTFETEFVDIAKGLPDLERIVSRVHAKNCKVKDFVKVLAVSFYLALASTITSLMLGPEGVSQIERRDVQACRCFRVFQVQDGSRSFEERARLIAQHQACLVNVPSGRQRSDMIGIGHKISLGVDAGL
jgi:hypothetical protein